MSTQKGAQRAAASFSRECSSSTGCLMDKWGGGGRGNVNINAENVEQPGFEAGRICSFKHSLSRGIMRFCLAVECMAFI